MDSDIKENLYCEDYGEYRSYCHFFDKISKASFL